MLRNLFAELWGDEAGSVIAAEYLLLGSIVGIGGTTGLVAMRDAMTGEYKEFGDSVRSIRQEYSYRGLHSPNASVGGSAVTDAPGHAQAVPSAQAAGVTFAAP
jgi:hypothetical protein